MNCTTHNYLVAACSWVLGSWNSEVRTFSIVRSITSFSAESGVVLMNPYIFLPKVHKWRQTETTPARFLTPRGEYFAAEWDELKIFLMSLCFSYFPIKTHFNLPTFPPNIAPSSLLIPRPRWHRCLLYRYSGLELVATPGTRGPGLNTGFLFSPVSALPGEAGSSCCVFWKWIRCQSRSKQKQEACLRYPMR